MAVYESIGEKSHINNPQKVDGKYIWIIIGGCLSAAIGIVLLIVLVLYLRKRTVRVQPKDSEAQREIKRKRLSSAYSSGDDAEQSLSYQILARSFSTDAAIPYKMNSECVQPCHPTLTRWHSFNSSSYPPTFLGTVQPDLYRESDDEDTTIPTGMNGRLWFSVHYRSDAQELDVNLVKAKHLSGRGLNNTSRDPFVRIYLLPDEENYLQSKVRRRTLSPKFNEKFTFQVEESDLCNRTLRMSIYDVDKRKVRHTLGHVIIPLDKIDLESNMLIWRDLESSALQTPTIRGEIQITLSCNPINGRIKTTVCRLRNIQGIDSGEAGIYTRVLLYHGRKHVKTKRTSLQHFNPAAGDVIFDESFAFGVSGRFFDSCSFEFVVVVAGQSPLVKDEILGHVIIGPFMYARGEQLLHWQEMLTNQRSPVTKWHGLEAIFEP